jgi:two-component system, LuxR family, response regulator FixJ
MSPDLFQEPWVFIVDDDDSFLGALRRLLSAKGYKTAAFASPLQFLDRHDPKRHGCLLLDLQMSELSGLDVQSRLAARGELRPVIFLTGINCVDAAVSAMKSGARNYLIKPVNAHILVDEVQRAIEEDKARLEARIEMSEFMSRWRMLSNREQEVFWHVANGQLNKQIAHHLSISKKTVQVHRSHVMEKLNAGSTAELARMAGRIRPLCN